MLSPWTLCPWRHCEEEEGFRRATGWFCGCYWGAPPQGAIWEKGAMCKWKSGGVGLAWSWAGLSPAMPTLLGDKCCPKRVAGGLGWSPGGCSRALGGCGMEKLPRHPTWAGLVELCLEQPTPARAVVSSDLFAFSLQDVSGRTGAVHYPCLENFPSPSMVMSPSLLQVFS